MRCSRILYFLGTCFCLVACVNLQDSPSSLIHGNEEDALSSNQFDYSARIQDDIYQFVNGRWLEFHPSELGKEWSSPVNNLIQRTEKQLLDILNELAEHPYQAKSDQYKLSLLYQKYLDKKSRDENRLIPLEPIFERIDGINDIQELTIFLYEMIQEGREIAFLKWNIFPNYEDSLVYRIYLLGPNLVLDEKYFKPVTNNQPQILNYYTDFVSTVLKHLDINNNRVMAQKIVCLEQKIASYTIVQNNELLGFQTQYKKRYLTELSQLSPILQRIIHGIKADETIFFIKEIEYFSQLERVIQRVDIDVIKAYLKYFYFIYYANYLDDDSYRLVFNFTKGRLLGEQRPPSMQTRAISFVNTYLGSALGQLYVKRYFPKDSKRRVLKLAEHIKKIFQKRVQTNTWLSQDTKDMLLKKLTALTIKVAYPEHWQNYHDLSLYDQLNLVEIVTRLDNMNYQHRKNKIGRKINAEEWTIYPQHTNAYYDILRNEVIYPAAILQDPFYKQNSDPAVLYGTLGALIAHEMTHSLDLKGAYYDEFGRYRAWNLQDNQRFNHRAQKLIAQYQRYKVIDEITVNGLKTVNENIADLGGVNIAYDALLDYLSQKPYTFTIAGFSQPQRFFLAWVSLFKGIPSEKKLTNSYFVDIHAPDKVRSFAPLLNMDAFYEIFGIGPQDQHYLAPKDRVHIW